MKGSTGMLTALPAHSLTHLNLMELQGPVDGPAMSAALARLSNPQQLHVTMLKAPYSCLAGVAQLTQLTLLDVSGMWLCSEQPLQQLLAQPLPLRVLRLNDYMTCLPWLDLSHLTHLEECCSPVLMNAAFPAQLQQLTLGSLSSNTMLQSVLQLQQLKCLTLADIFDDAQACVPYLPQLPALQQLVLKYSRGEWAAAAAAASPRLPQLCELVIPGEGYLVTRQEWEATLSCVAASTNLTKLRLAVQCDGEDGEDEDEVGDGTWNAPSAKLASLTNLKDLTISSAKPLLAPGEALALAALTGLTRLELNNAGAGVGDLAATALAGSCKQLCHLELAGCNLASMACLANVRHLTQLTELSLCWNTGLKQQGLMMLTGLKRLQHLTEDRNDEVTTEMVESFWAAVKGQQPQLR